MDLTYALETFPLDNESVERRTGPIALTGVTVSPPAGTTDERYLCSAIHSIRLIALPEDGGLAIYHTLLGPILGPAVEMDGFTGRWHERPNCFDAPPGEQIICNGIVVEHSGPLPVEVTLHYSPR